MDTYRKWMDFPNLDVELQKDLASVTDESDINDRFYKDLEFGTGGLRGIMGAGTNRMNIYTVRRATLGLARYLQSQGQDAAAKGVVIGYDCRHMSREFAEEVGRVLAAVKIPAYVFEHLCPTPEVSYAVRSLKTAAGIMVTASHNPPEYNGYKVYGPDGGQVLPETAKKIIDEIEKIDDIFGIAVMDKTEAQRQGLFQFVGHTLDEAYMTAVLQAVLQTPLTTTERANLKVVYTPLHGTGNIPVRECLKRAGYGQTTVPASQEQPDGDFPTVKSPNPEEPEALRLAIEEARRCDADIVMGSDPDADRVGIAVRTTAGDYRLFTGNQVGGLLVDFLLTVQQSEGTLPSNGIVFKTIVTSELGGEAARSFGLTVENTLTGFKYIGDRIGHYEATGEHTFVFGYEESYGYLASPIVRDKDAVQICLLVAEMAAHYKAHGITLVDALENLHKKVGYFSEALVSEKLPGEDGMAKMEQMMDNLRNHGFHVDGLQLKAVEDYLLGLRRDKDTGTETQLTLPKENVLKYFFTNDSWLAIRPSGTEPKIKVYIGARGHSDEDCAKALKTLQTAVTALLH